MNREKLKAAKEAAYEALGGEYHINQWKRLAQLVSNLDGGGFVIKTNAEAKKYLLARYKNANPKRAVERHRQKHLRPPKKNNSCSKNNFASANEFYKSWEWKKARFLILKKYGPVCMLCGSNNRIVVDHIKPRSRFPDLELELNNLQVLCNDCNMGKSNDDYTDFRPCSYLSDPE